jgi:stearoyl-CoA desaturase (delta-9 desaturase)
VARGSARSRQNELEPSALINQVNAESDQVRLFSPRHIAFFAPVILLHLGCGLVVLVGLSGPAMTALLITGTLQIFGITAGYHRLLAHRSFKTSRPFQFILAFFGVLAGQNGPLWWVGHHRHHHRYSDRGADVHSPQRGFFWSHMGWLFSPECVAVRHGLVRDLARCPELQMLQRYYYVCNLGYALLLYAAGETWRYIEPSSPTSGLQLMIWGSIVSTVCVYHCIWSANSFCHRFGTRRFATPDHSRNNLLVSLVTFGDGWHHNHHYCPYSARHGFRWWEIDLNFAILRLLAWVGIVWDLKLPPADTLGLPPRA